MALPRQVIEERTRARIELDRVLIRGHVPERHEAIRRYVRSLDRCIEYLRTHRGDEVAEMWIGSLTAEREPFEQWLKVAEYPGPVSLFSDETE